MVVPRSFRIYSHSIVEDRRNSYEAKLRTHCVDPLHNSYGSSCINVSGFFGESDPGTSSEFLKYEIHRNSVIEDEVLDYARMYRWKTQLCRTTCRCNLYYDSNSEELEITQRENFAVISTRENSNMLDTKFLNAIRLLARSF